MTSTIIRAVAAACSAVALSTTYAMDDVQIRIEDGGSVTLVTSSASFVIYQGQPIALGEIVVRDQAGEIKGRNVVFVSGCTPRVVAGRPLIKIGDAGAKAYPWSLGGIKSGDRLAAATCLAAIGGGVVDMDKTGPGDQSAPNGRSGRKS